MARIDPRSRGVFRIVTKTLPRTGSRPGEFAVSATPVIVVDWFAGDMQPVREWVREHATGPIGEATHVLFPQSFLRALTAVNFRQENHFVQRRGTNEEWEVTGVVPFSGASMEIACLQKSP